MARTRTWGLCLLLAAHLAALGISQPDDVNDPDILAQQVELRGLAKRLQKDPKMVAKLEAQLARERNEDSPALTELDRDSTPQDATSSESESSDSDSSDSSSSQSESADNDKSKQEPRIDTGGAEVSDKSTHNTPKQSKDDGDMPFPCPRHFHSSFDIPPKSVHQLMPRDVKVVAAMGDSLTAARGAGVRSFMAMLFDYRGLSWSIGGDESYSVFTSLPNILREYNPDLYGFSNGRDEDSPGLNVAVTAATSNNLQAQTKRLIRIMQTDPNVDFQNDWKVITIFIGGNDVCRACLARKLTAENFAANLKDSLDMLQDNVPRAFVNVVELMKVEMAPEIVKQSGICENTLSMLCACMAIPRNEAAFERNLKMRKEYQKAAEDVVNSGDYDHKTDFTVVLQPFYKDTDPPKKQEPNLYKKLEKELTKARSEAASKKSNLTTDGPFPGPDYEIDLTYFAADCFHYSRKGQASAGLNLYNNMLQPVGHKSIQWTGSDKLLCPSSQFPYFATRNNSRAMLKYWKNGEPIVTDAVNSTKSDYKVPQVVEKVKLEDALLAREKTKVEVNNDDDKDKDADTSREPSGRDAEEHLDMDTDDSGDTSVEEPDGSLALVVVAMIAVSIGLVGLAGVNIHRKRGKSNLYDRIL